MCDYHIYRCDKCRTTFRLFHAHCKDAKSKEPPLRCPLKWSVSFRHEDKQWLCMTCGGPPAYGYAIRRPRSQDEKDSVDDESARVKEEKSEKDEIERVVAGMKRRLMSEPRPRNKRTRFEKAEAQGMKSEADESKWAKSLIKQESSEDKADMKGTTGKTKDADETKDDQHNEAENGRSTERAKANGVKHEEKKAHGMKGGGEDGINSRVSGQDEDEDSPVIKEELK